MNKLSILMLCTFVFLLFCGCRDRELPTDASSITYVNPEIFVYNTTMKRDILCLFMGYPGFFKGVETENEKVYVVLNSGARILYDDKKTKTFSEKLNNPDIQDMMEQLYPLDGKMELMEENFDPGRIRIYPILKEVYGAAQNEIEKNLAHIWIGGKKLKFNRQNNAAKKLDAVMKEVNNLIRYKASIGGFVYPAGGTFNYRLIAGTGRLSSHAFGTAVDLAVNKADYWKWSSRKQGEDRLLAYPAELVKAFESHGFIWGGRWGHFDIMHYEYRPEIIYKARFFNKMEISDKPWHTGIESKTESIREYIQMIDKLPF